MAGMAGVLDSRARLLGALLMRMSQRDGLQRMLDDLEDLPREELLDELISDFEKIVARRRVEQLVEVDLERDLRALVAERPIPRAAMPLPVEEKPQLPVVTPVMTPSPPTGDLPVSLAAAPVVKADAPVMKTTKHDSHGKDRSDRSRKPAARPEPPKERSRPPQREEPPQVGMLHQRTGVDLKEGETVYLHGFTLLPSGEEAASKPFMLEEKGIEGKDFAFAVDRAGMRFFASTLRTYAANVNRNGVFLLNKQESIRLRGVHASILNELRAHGTLMPFAFGTVVAGREELYRKLDDRAAELRQALDAQLQTTWWDLSVYALDSRIAEFLTPDGLSGRRERDRGRESYTVGPAGQKLDIKALEKILGKEKKLAEGIHEELMPIADRADVDMMVGFGNGSSDDWKLILKSSYELPPSRVHWFCRTLTELQYRHFIYELMLVFDGAREPFTFT
jgi:hypothetical protein